MIEQVNVKKNIVYNILLTISTYVAALIVYPYASRVLGVENIGIVGFVLKTIDGFVIFSTLGVTIVGIREIASIKNDKQKLSKVYSSLVSILGVSTLLVTIAYIVGILFIPSLNNYYKLFIIGLSKLIASAFLIEWFYQGIEDFRYITIRNLALKLVYIVAVFIFIREKEDYNLYLLLNVLVVVFNSIINWGTSRKYVKFKFSLKDTRLFIIPVLVYGGYQVLNAVYSTFNYTFLGTYCSSIEVGYYYTAEQFYAILLSIITAITKVLMPRTSNLLSEKKYDAFNQLIEKSFSSILSICIPLALVGVFYASNIINIMVGEEYTGAVLPLQIMLILILINGINQIFIIQVAMPLRLDKEILIGTVIASILALAFNKVLLVNLGAVGASIILVISVIIANIYPVYIILKKGYIKLPLKCISNCIIKSFPYLLICVIVYGLPINSDYVRLGVVGGLCGLVFLFLNKETFWGIIKK